MTSTVRPRCGRAPIARRRQAGWGGWRGSGCGLVGGADLAPGGGGGGGSGDVAAAGWARRPDLAFVFVCGPRPRPAWPTAGERAAQPDRRRPPCIGCSAPGRARAPGRAVGGADRGRRLGRRAARTCDVRTFHLEVMPADGGMAVVGLPERRDDDDGGRAARRSLVVPGRRLRRAVQRRAARRCRSSAASPRAGAGAARPGCSSTATSLDRGAVGVLLGGPVGARALVSQGCRPVGPTMTVTAADGNVAPRARRHPGARRSSRRSSSASTPEDQALASAGLQLGVAMDEYADEHGIGDFLVRGVAGADDARRGLVVGDLVEVGRTVRFQLRDAVTADADLRASLQPDASRRSARRGRGRAAVLVQRARRAPVRRPQTTT